MPVAVGWILAAVFMQGQESLSPREHSRDATVPSGLDGISEQTTVTASDVSPLDLQPVDLSPIDLPPIDASHIDVSQGQDPAPTTPVADGKSSGQDSPKPQATTSKPSNPDEEYGKQEKRILGLIPNYRAVSANTHLPPLNFKSELWLATQDTFDYSDFIFVGALAGLDMAGKSTPAFGQGAEGFGKYYWHVFVDSAVENYMTEAIVPAVTKEDPRYYTMGKGGFPKRTVYALSQLFITRTNSGTKTINLSEIVGSGAAAGLGNTYYPAESNPFVKTYQRWGTQVGLDGLFNVLKEFWPDINRKIFRGKY